MPKTQTPPITCTSCKGRGYALSNRKGRVHADLCACFHCDKCDGEGRIFRENEKGIAYLMDCECAVLKKRLRVVEDAGLSRKTFPPWADNPPGLLNCANSICPTATEEPPTMAR